MALLVRVEKNGETIKRVGFSASPVRIGRNPLNELCIEDPVVSQWHALIRFDESQQQIIVMDLGSTNGTAFDGQRLQRHAPVFVGQSDVLSIGPIHLNVVLANVPVELVDDSRQVNFNTSLAGGKATMMVSPEQAKTMMADVGVSISGIPGPPRGPS